MGQDVHIVGWKLENEIKVAKYWKNCEEFNLNDNNEWSEAQSIAINDGDVYILGMQKNIASYTPIYWKNGIKTILEDEGNYYPPNYIAVTESGNVYIALRNSKYYFKNGERIYFSKLNTNSPRIDDIKVVPK